MIDTNNVIPIGQILFDEKIVMQGKMDLVSQDILDVLQSQTWLISKSLLLYKKMANMPKTIGNPSSPISINLIYINLSSVTFQLINSDNNPEPMILKEIASINFLQLKWLFLRQNRINNIEAIAWLEAPKLEKLILSDNEFISIKPLQKLNAPHLAQLHINGNPFKKAPLDRIKMSEVVDCISLQEIETDRIVACDLSEYAKTNIKKMDLIQIEGSRRIRQQKVRMSLSRKYGMIRLSKQDKKNNLKNLS